MASATRHRSGGSHTEAYDSRSIELDDVARPTLEDLAAQPQLHLLHVSEASGPSGRAATSLASFGRTDHEESRHALDGRTGRETSRDLSVRPSQDANTLRTSQLVSDQPKDTRPLGASQFVGDQPKRTSSPGTAMSATKMLAALATVAWLSGCSAAKSPEQGGGNCLQAAAGQSFQTPAPDDVSTEGGGLGHHDGRARDVVPVPGVLETVGAGGAASNQESTGSGRAARDRSGLVDVWPEASPPKTDLTTRSVLSKG